MQTSNILLKNKHFNTLYRYFRANSQVNYIRERMQTKDADFIDLDRSSVASDEVIIAVHGLEGSSNSSYIRSLSEFANKQNFDVIAVNLRGCSGEPNLTLGSYHSGRTSDLFEIIEYVKSTYSYENIHIVGYSLGGNMTIKFMGEFAENLPKEVKSAIAISAPCDLKGSGEAISKFSNKLYQYNFLKTLKKKAKFKIEKYPDANLQANKIIRAKNFYEFDEYFTAIVHGYLGAEDYYKKCSSKQFIKAIKKPTLLINALDDPFLSESCYPFEESKENPNFHFSTPKYGGHVGFYTNLNPNNNFWLENQIVNFIKDSKVI